MDVAYLDPLYQVTYRTAVIMSTCLGEDLLWCLSCGCWQVVTGFVETSVLAHGSFHRAACHTGCAYFRLSKLRESEDVAQMEAIVFLRPNMTACVCASLCPEHSFSHSCDLLPLIFQASSSVTPSESFCKVVYPVCYISAPCLLHL